MAVVCVTVWIAPRRFTGETVSVAGLPVTTPRPPPTGVTFGTDESPITDLVTPLIPFTTAVRTAVGLPVVAAVKVPLSDA